MDLMSLGAAAGVLAVTTKMGKRRPSAMNLAMAAGAFLLVNQLRQGAVGTEGFLDPYRRLNGFLDPYHAPYSMPVIGDQAAIGHELV